MSHTPSPRYVALLALVAVAVLGLGYLLRPSPRTEIVVGAPSPAEVRRLQRLALRRSVEGLPEYAALVARDVAPYVVRIGSDGHTAVVWTTDFALSTPVPWRASTAATLVTAEGDLLPAGVTVSGPHLPLAGFQAPISQGLGPAPRRNAPVAASEWLIAAWRDGAELAFAPGLASGSITRIGCGEATVSALSTTLPLQPAMAGGGLFDLDGRLVGMILPCGGGLAALSNGSVETLVQQGQLLESRLLARFGMGVAAPDEAERAHFGVDRGVVVREVWQGYPALASGLRAGDVVRSLDDADVATPSDLEEMLSPALEGPHRLSVLRGGRALDVSLGMLPPPAPDAPPAADRGLRLADETEGIVIHAVAAGSPAERAGIRPGDRLLRVDHDPPRNMRALQRRLAGGEPGVVFVEIARGPRQIGALLGP